MMVNARLNCNSLKFPHQLHKALHGHLKHAPAKLRCGRGCIAARSVAREPVDHAYAPDSQTDCRALRRSDQRCAQNQLLKLRARSAVDQAALHRYRKPSASEIRIKGQISVKTLKDRYHSAPTPFRARLQDGQGYNIYLYYNTMLQPRARFGNRHHSLFLNLTPEQAPESFVTPAIPAYQSESKIIHTSLYHLGNNKNQVTRVNRKYNFAQQVTYPRRKLLI